MTKRPPPYELNICRQSKIHLNNYENDLKALKSVEEQTLKKLMNGSRKQHAIILNNKNSNFDGDIHHKNSNFMQKCLSDYFSINGQKRNENTKVPTSCFEETKKCFFCDSKSSSIHQCAKCLDFYCPACSFVIYESSEDKTVCLSCS